MWEGIFAPNFPALGPGRQSVGGCGDGSDGIGCMDLPLRDGAEGIHHDALLSQTQFVIDLLVRARSAYVNAILARDMTTAEHHGAALADAVDRLRDGDLVLHERHVHQLGARAALIQDFRARSETWRPAVAALKRLVRDEFAFERADLVDASSRRKAFEDVRAWLVDEPAPPPRWNDVLTNATRLRDLVTKKPAVLAAELAAAELGRSRSALEKLAAEVDRVRDRRPDEVLVAHRAKPGPKPKQG